MHIERTVRSADFPEPTPKLRSGDLFYVRRAFHTVADVQFCEGDAILLLAPTDSAPYGCRASTGNWWVKAKNQATVWSSIEWLLSVGWIERADV